MTVIEKARKLQLELHKSEVINETLQNCLNCANHEENRLYVIYIKKNFRLKKLNGDVMIGKQEYDNARY